jgi:hypothetical protein
MRGNHVQRLSADRTRRSQNCYSLTHWPFPTYVILSSACPEFVEGSEDGASWKTQYTQEMERRKERYAAQKIGIEPI